MTDKTYGLVKTYSTTGNPMVFRVSRGTWTTHHNRKQDADIVTRWYGTHIATRFDDGWRLRSADGQTWTKVVSKTSIDAFDNAPDAPDAAREAREGE